MYNDCTLIYMLSTSSQRNPSKNAFLNKFNHTNITLIEWGRKQISLRVSSYAPCPGLLDYIMVWIKEPFIKNEKSTIDVLISCVNKI